MVLQKGVAYLSRRGIEVLTAKIHQVYPLIGEVLVQQGFNADRILREEQGVNVEQGRHRRVTKFTHALHRVQPAGHTDFHDPIAEGPEVGDDVDIPGASVQSIIFGVGELSLGLFQLLLNSLDTANVADCIMVNTLFVCERNNTAMSFS